MDLWFKPASIPEIELPGGSEIVLIAEDDKVLWILFRTVLTEFGYTVIEAEDGVDAVYQNLSAAFAMVSTGIIYFPFSILPSILIG
jgi:hypothetical protein